MNLELKAQWRSPANIALIKYWGKHGDQLPKNPSISFTLNQSVTNLSIKATKEKDSKVVFFFEGKENAKFQEKINVYLEKIQSFFPWLKNHHLEIRSSNTFPHSSGIASSASSMSALCLCLLSVDEYVMDKKYEESEFFKKASELSRLASGSASRSVYSGLASWGEHPDVPLSSNFFATQFDKEHEVFKNYCDSILIVDANEKSVSSRAGHGLMENHLFKEQRFLQAKNNFFELVLALKSGDLDSFIRIVEEEALTLHALMMTSHPSYILLRGESLWLIEQIRKFRLEKNIPVCFTIDAGPNVHLLYPNRFSDIVRPWIEKELTLKLPNMKFIHDKVGTGPERF